ncbi:MAG: SDR family NAD(P)-dependent oxidoreductase [Paracoccaceae bacterium]
MGRLDVKTTLVTAAGQGIGRATAEKYAAEGTRVSATDINPDSLTELAGCDGVSPAKAVTADFGMADEMAALALHLASGDSAFTTGQTHIIVDGWAI